MLASRLLRSSLAARSLSAPLRSSPLRSSPLRQLPIRRIPPVVARWTHDSSARPPPPQEKPQNQPSQEPQKPLPDLRQGIPSTFAQEFSNQQDTHKDGAEEPAHEQEDGGAKEIPKAAYESSIDRRRNRMAQWFFIVATAGISLAAFRLGRNWPSEAEEKAHPDAPSGWAFDLMWKRIQARVNDQMGYYTEPTFPKLLPDVDKIDVPVPPYTLVISLENMLVHEDWSRKGGYRVAKRPGMDFFLMYLSQYYELCLFTTVPFAIGSPVQSKVDPYHFIMWPLFREATRYDNGDYVKDLSYLNRPLDKVILLDTKEAHAKAQPENAIILPPWKGDPEDRELLSLIPFLEYVAAMGLDDVREALKTYEGKNISHEFARREAAMRAELMRRRELEVGRGGAKRSGLAGLIGGGAAAQQQNPLMPGDKMIFDLIREDGMRRYRAIEKEVKENGAKWLREEAEMMKKLEESSAKDMKKSFVGGLSKWVPFLGDDEQPRPAGEAPAAETE